jgi:hypothetical protein
MAAITVSEDSRLIGLRTKSHIVASLPAVTRGRQRRHRGTVVPIFIGRGAPLWNTLSAPNAAD